ncbi:hypothetical protein FA09DRAFT_211447 [Tilletiopsis washingtonensis]|uniref:Uncharacterized protein n=1 Tax=Tilletiopsis washingtonensis TaxID=58919 RepID=A0A316ZJ16_9BASI|nr:hypothetical protein FA09DRAFT_211447 [Tilletiopsis washingtonensis]PWO00254.1 hypothetical protein FA09DRAFT_211447 [Tilletiopsis washingtonensis]
MRPRVPGRLRAAFTLRFREPRPTTPYLPQGPRQRTLRPTSAANAAAGARGRGGFARVAAATRRRGEIGRVRGRRRLRCGDPVGLDGECGEAARRYTALAPMRSRCLSQRLEGREAPEQQQHMGDAPDESHTASALGGGDGAPGCAQTLSAALFPSEPGEGWRS